MVYRLLTIITPFVTTPILSRALGAERLGVYSASLAWVNYFVLLSMLGINNYGNRCIASAQSDDSERQKLFWNIYCVQFCACIAAILFYVASFIVITPERYTITTVQGLWLLSSLLNINWYFFGTERFRLTITRSIIIKIISVSLIVTLIRQPDDLALYALIMAGDAVLSNGLLWPFLIKDLRYQKPTWSAVRQHIRPAFLLFIPVLAISVFHVMDKTMLDFLSTESEVGYYYSADKVINIPLMAITAVSTVMMPRISNLYSTGSEEDVNNIIHQSFELTVFLTCSLGIGIASIAKEFIPLFFGMGYDPCINLVYWFIPVLFVKSISDFIRMQYIIPTHHDKLYIYAICTGALINAAFNAMLIPHHGAIGAVWATLIAEITVAVFQVYFVRNSLPLAQFFLLHSLYLLFSAIMLVAVRALAVHLGLSVWLKLFCMVCTGAAVYICCCVIYWRHRTDSVFHSLFIKH